MLPWDNTILEDKDGRIRGAFEVECRRMPSCRRREMTLLRGEASDRFFERAECLAGQPSLV